MFLEAWPKDLDFHEYILYFLKRFNDRKMLESFHASLSIFWHFTLII